MEVQQPKAIDADLECSPEPEIRHTTPSQLVDHEQRAKFSRHIIRAIKRG